MEVVMSFGVCLITTEEVYKKIVGKDALKGITIKLKKDADREKVSEYLKGISTNNPKIKYTDYSEDAKEHRKINIIISIFLYGFVGVITLIGCLNIINTISTNLILRTRELSMLKAIGMSNGGIKRLVCYESMIYGIVSAIYGGIIGTGLSYVLFNILMEMSEFPWAIS
jgi:putative ABC transport system permease protein